MPLTPIHVYLDGLYSVIIAITVHIHDTSA